jgi:hypothetical protein
MGGENFRLSQAVRARRGYHLLRRLDFVIFNAGSTVQLGNRAGSLSRQLTTCFLPTLLSGDCVQGNADRTVNTGV